MEFSKNLLSEPYFLLLNIVASFFLNSFAINSQHLFLLFSSFGSFTEARQIEAFLILSPEELSIVSQNTIYKKG